MGVNSLFIFLTHKTRLIRQFLPKHMAEGSQADLPEHGEAQSGQKRADEQRIPQDHEPQHNIHAGIMHRAQPYRTRKHREGPEGRIRPARSPNQPCIAHRPQSMLGSKAHLMHIRSAARIPPYERLRRRTTSVGSHQAKGAMARVQRNFHTSAFEADARATNSGVYEITLRATRGCG